VGNRVDEPSQQVGSSSPVVACKNTATPLPKGGMEVGRRKGSIWCILGHYLTQTKDKVADSFFADKIGDGGL